MAYELDHYPDFGALFDEEEMAANLMSQGVPPASSTGDGHTSTGGGGGRGGDTRVLQEQGVQGGNMFGPSTLARRNKRLPYDLMDALSEGEKIVVETTSNAVMPISEAGARLNGLFLHCGLGGASPGMKHAFHMAILLANAKNSSSIAQPNRAVIRIPGVDQINYHADVLAYLGDDSRRFFRAYAEEMVMHLKAIRTAFEQGDEDYRADIEELDVVARGRGLERFKHLVGDGSEFCPGLSSAEYLAVERSKAIVLSNTTNAVDNARVYRAPRSSVETPAQDVAADVPY